MTANLVFWLLALILLAAVAALGWRGRQLARRGEYARHGRYLQAAAWLVVVFLVAYLTKVALLGKEMRDCWPAFGRPVLWVHETAIALMLVAGGVALALRGPTAGTQGARRHRISGVIAVVASVAGLVTGVVLFGAMGQAVRSEGRGACVPSRPLSPAPEGHVAVADLP